MGQETLEFSNDSGFCDKCWSAVAAAQTLNARFTPEYIDAWTVSRL